MEGGRFDSERLGNRLLVEPGADHCEDTDLSGERPETARALVDRLAENAARSRAGMGRHEFSTLERIEPRAD